ncbi:MAG: hypothetical protein G01um10142_69 [Parcubacteria group bacterium Gr01-1014_2]|nr:MAG: hypothetical protein G01um10142_69 [Parcubacteria group bacterium Gr01-1014_2]
MNKGILKTIVYYDCLDYPLTGEELKIFAFKNSHDLKDNDLIEIVEGFHFLKGRSDLIRIREKRKELSKTKWEKTLKAVKWLGVIPYIKLIFASGSLALSNTDKESDLDVLIVAKHGRIWLARFLAALLLGLLGLRRKRHQRVAPDKICFNHFITDKSLYIPRKSIYTAQLYARLVPILVSDEKLINDFCEANSWIKEYIPKFQILPIRRANRGSSIPQSGIGTNSKFLKFIKNISEKILDTKLGDWLESVLRKYQLRRINSYHLTHKVSGTLSVPNSHAKRGGRVKADDESLEFHPDSPELKILENYNKKMIELGFEDLTEETSFDK